MAEIILMIAAVLTMIAAFSMPFLVEAFKERGMTWARRNIRMMARLVPQPRREHWVKVWDGQLYDPDQQLGPVTGYLWTWGTLLPTALSLAITERLSRTQQQRIALGPPAEILGFKRLGTLNGGFDAGGAFLLVPTRITLRNGDQTANFDAVVKEYIGRRYRFDLDPMKAAFPAKVSFERHDE